jgi:hypothetical protein
MNIHYALVQNLSANNWIRYVCNKMHFLETSSKKTQLVNVLSTYNLRGTVCFPTRIVNNSATLIDNIFIHNRRGYLIKPCINGLSDHDVQLIICNNIPVLNRALKAILTRNINNNTIAEFSLY